MGQVYRATDSRLGREIALKVLPKEFSRDATLRSRFMREAKAASALNHPNVVSVHDVGQAEEIFYIVSELVDGESLREVIARGRIAPNRIVDLATQMADGLAAAHAAGIVHRDLKPENILVTRAGHVKIIDFGIAKQVLSAAATQGTDAPHTLTMPGTVVGTVGYMSPEQICGQQADTRTDIFSLGIILFEMASGRTAFTGATVPEVVSATLKDDPPELQVEGLPPGLALIIRRCLEKDPKARFQSASDLAFAIRNLTAIPPETGTRPAPPQKKRSLAWVGWVAAAAVVLVAGGWWMLRYSATKSTESTLHAAQPKQAAATPVPAAPMTAPAKAGAEKPSPSGHPAVPKSTAPAAKAIPIPATPASPPAQTEDTGGSTTPGGRFAPTFARAQQANQDGDYDAAAALFTAAIRVKPDAPIAYLGRGRAYLRLRKFDMALHDFTAAIGLKPDLAAAYAERGRVHNQLGQYRPALEDFNEALRLNPELGSVYAARAVAKSNLGDSAGAAEDRKRAREFSK